MYGLISRMRAAPGQRDTLMTILGEGSRDMPGCLSYVIAADQADDTGIWITEVWDSAESHKASLKLEQVQKAIAIGQSLIEGFDHRAETLPLYGPQN